MGKKTIGFGSDPNAAGVGDQRNRMLQHATVDDVIEFGMIPELVGRLPVVSALHPLSEDDLVHIMTEPKNSLVRQYQKFFQLENAQLEFSPDSLREIARIALAKDTGARGLRSVIEGLMFDIMYDLPEQEPGRVYVITPEVVRGETKLSLRDGSRIVADPSSPKYLPSAKMRLSSRCGGGSSTPRPITAGIVLRSGVRAIGSRRATSGSARSQAARIPGPVFSWSGKLSTRRCRLRHEAEMVSSTIRRMVRGTAG